ncbi:MAG: hypothetical protein PVG14_09835 [Anaerolineales bacterium]|jgi:hypothetical protein
MRIDTEELLPYKRIFQTWWPLAASWVLMAAELPALSAVVARLPNPEINLAAYGGVVFPLALIIEAPIIMLLAASTALSKDWDSYIKIRTYMLSAGAILTGLHVLTAFTPLYYVVVEGILGAPDEIVEPARIGLMIMTPWTWSIAYRRFNQGVLIRFGHSQSVGIGTVIRLSADIVILTLGYVSGSFAGIVVATGAVAAGVISEALYVGLRVRPVLNTELKPAPKVEPPLSYREFFDFYIPLALTSLLTLLVQPIGSAALSRMPRALESLAVWPVVSGLIFILRSMGMAYNEVVVATLDEPGSAAQLRRFTTLLSGTTTIMLLVFTATPLADVWFESFSGLSPKLASLARSSLWLALPMPAANVLQSWYQGVILHNRRTRGIPEAVVIFMVTISIILWAGVVWGKIAGLYIGLGAFSTGVFAQNIWLWFRSRPAMEVLNERDTRRTASKKTTVSSD